MATDTYQRYDYCQAPGCGSCAINHVTLMHCAEMTPDNLGVVNSHEHQEIVKRILKAQAREQATKPVTGRTR